MTFSILTVKMFRAYSIRYFNKKDGVTPMPTEPAMIPTDPAFNFDGEVAQKFVKLNKLFSIARKMKMFDNLNPHAVTKNHVTGKRVCVCS